MKFAHISDLHIDSCKQVIYGVNPCKNLEKALTILAGFEDLDAVILSGDISNDGKEASYLQADAMLSGLSVPVYCVLGNHDNRLVVERLLEEHKLNSLRFVKDVVLAGYKILFLNSVKEESPGENMSRGFVSRDDLERIDREASLFPGNIILVMHHPAIEVGGWMDARILMNREEFKSMVSRHSNIVAVLAGHNHCPSELTVDGCLYSIAPSVSTTFDTLGARFQEVYRPAFDVYNVDGDSLSKHMIPIDC